MNKHKLLTFAVSGICLAASCSLANADVVVAKNGAAKVSGIYLSTTDKGSPLLLAAQDLQHAITKMSGVTVAIKTIKSASEIPKGPAIVLGAPAASLGAVVKDNSKWKNRERTVIKNGRILVAGQSDMAVNNGIMNLLHEQGVRYFLPTTVPDNIGTIMPHKTTIEWSDRDKVTHPLVPSRRVWGHNMGQHEPNRTWNSAWVRRNGGISDHRIRATHAWGGLIPKSEQKPEYFAIKRYDKDGNPVQGGQFNTSNPEVAKLVAQTLIKRFEANPDLISQSISPNDGGGADLRPASRAMDVPGYIEPSSGRVVLSDRYTSFFNSVADIVSKKFPNRYLAFYVYSDYSRAPKRVKKLNAMLVPVFAPIRYPRTMSMFNPLSEENVRQRNTILKYLKMAKQFGYYGYNYNLAETTVPFSKISIWSSDLPWLVKKGLMSAVMESIGNWNTNGPSIYLSTRYLSHGGDPAKIMDDFYSKLCGAAAPGIRAYWNGVDNAFRNTDIQSGSFFGIAQILSPKVLSQLQGHLGDAAKEANTAREKAVVAFYQSGLDQGKLAVQTINNLNQFEFIKADSAYEKLQALNTKLKNDGTDSKYPGTYSRLFLGRVVQNAASIIKDGGKIAVKFPNQSLFRIDPYDVGVEEEWFDPSHGNARWLTAKTFGAPSLYLQGFGDIFAYQWFKNEVKVPAGNVQNLRMWFGSNDGPTSLWINGKAVPFEVSHKDRKTKKVTTEEVYEYPKSWKPFSVPVGKYLKAGQTNTFVIRIHHKSLNDLNLGGILRPVMLYTPGNK